MGLTRLDLLWIKALLGKVVVHGTEQDELFRVTEKINHILERNTHGTAGQTEPRNAA